MSHSMYRRRRWRTVATTLALTLGSLAIPAAALADGLIDPNFNGTGYHPGSAAEGTVLGPATTASRWSSRPTARSSSAARAGGAMTLIRYNLDGSVDTTFGNGGVAQRQFAGTPTGVAGQQRRDGDDARRHGNIIVAGFGGSQSMFVARYSAAGTFISSVVCFAPHLIDYSARALAVKPNGQVVLVGYARDRHAAVLDPTGSRSSLRPARRRDGPADRRGARRQLAPAELLWHVHRSRQPLPGLGQRHRSTACSTTARAPIATLAGRQYDGVTAHGQQRYTVGSTIGPDGAGWIQRYNATGQGAVDGARILIGRHELARAQDAGRRLGPGGGRHARRHERI